MSRILSLGLIHAMHALTSVNFNVICATNEHQICNQHLKISTIRYPQSKHHSNRVGGKGNLLVTDIASSSEVGVKRPQVI